MKKVLMLASVASMIDQFNMMNIKLLQEMGCEVYVVANFQTGSTTSKERVNIFKDELIQMGIKVFDIGIDRNVLSSANIKAYKQIKKLIDQEQFDLIHCHSPIGGVISRLAARKVRKIKTKVVYTAHGFHFFKGAPRKNWLIYFPIEKWLSKYTDCLLTINDEDYNNAINNKFRAVTIKHINGIGIDLKKFSPQTMEDKSKLRNEYNYTDKDFILIYAGELSYRKHQDILIDAVSKLKEKIPTIKLLLAGTGSLDKQYKEQAIRLNVEHNIEFLGYRRDISNLMKLSDLVVSSSRQEGLPVNIMEAMATGLPLVVSDCRGNRDLVKDRINGFVVGIDAEDDFASSIEQLYSSEELRTAFSMKSLELVEKYSSGNVMSSMKEIYHSLLEGK